MQDERREFQRLRLSKPILATMRGGNALVLDVGVAGAFLEHYGTAEPGEKLELRWRWQGEEIAFRCEVAHSTAVRKPGGDGESTVSHTGVRFVEAVGNSHERLQQMIASYVGTILTAQKANASGTGRESAGANILARLGEARRMRSRGYISYRYKDDTWWRIPTQSAVQPVDGFTIGPYEDEDEIEVLCRTYEQSDEDGRGLIRMIAEISLQPSTP
jgi:hypothetical protein